MNMPLVLLIAICSLIVMDGYTSYKTAPEKQRLCKLEAYATAITPPGLRVIVQKLDAENARQGRSI